MKTFEFELHVNAKDFSGDPENTLDLLYEAGLDDALVSWTGDDLTIQFDREAQHLAEAILTAIQQIESIPGLIVTRVLPMDLVTAAEISRRMGKTRPWASQIIAGKRGPGTFPPAYPLAHLPTPMWRWADVQAWFEDDSQPDKQMEHEAAVISLLNAALDLRNISGRSEIVAADRASVSTVLSQVQFA